jgi:ABC-type cobalt transport system substrate-binding protein
MAIYDHGYLPISDNMRYYLRLASVGAGIWGVAIHNIQQIAPNFQPWGLDANDTKSVLFGIGASALISTYVLGKKAGDKIRSETMGIEDRLNQDSDDNSIDRAA